MTPSANHGSSLVAACLDFVFPSLCAGCGAYTVSDTGLCDCCRTRLGRYDTPFCANCLSPLTTWPECPACRRDTLPLFAVGDYVDPLKQAIAEFKFHDVRSHLPWLTRQLVDTFAVKLAACQAEALVPVPLHPAREYERGYNQAAVLAVLLGPLLDLPVEKRLFARTIRRRPQQRLRARERESNIRDVFTALPSSQTGLRLLVVDDVVTSGSTVRELARTLIGAGHVVTGVVSLAHGA